MFLDKYGGENQGAFSKDNLKEFADELGLDTEAFNTCLDSGRYESLVTAERTTAQQLGVRATPAFLVNGQPVVGAQPFETFQQIIESELNSAQ